MQKPPSEFTSESHSESTSESADRDSTENESRPVRRRRRRRAIPDTSVPSPCVAVCQYNSEQLCEGCLRTPDEIRDWIIMSREQKLAVLSKLAERRQSAAK